MRSTVILGAGASRGASFANSSRQVLPPLDADFFQQAQRLDEAQFKGAGREVTKFVREEYGTTDLPTLETVFTQLQGYEQFLRSFYARPGRRPGGFKKQLDHLLDLIPLLFRAAFENQRCEWHDRIAFALRKGDAVISFNYDVLIDEALARLSDGIWMADRGYGVKPTRGVKTWSASPTPGALPRKEYLRLLKPHGSLHWAIGEGKEDMRLESKAYARRSARGNIIPPTWDKTVLGEWPWKPIWKEASTMLQDTRCLIVIGYSVPPTDLSSQALIRSSLSGGNLRLVVVVNPDANARGRVIDLARGAITSNTRIVELDQLQDFAQLLDETPTQRRQRQEVVRRLRKLTERVESVEDVADALTWHDLDDLEERVDDLEEQDFEELENRLDAVEAQVNSLETDLSALP